MPGRGRYMISVAADLAGLHPQTLRMYEARGLVRPGRTPGGARLYSQNAIERLGRAAGPPAPPAGPRPGRPPPLLRERHGATAPRPAADDRARAEPRGRRARPAA